MSRSRGQAGFTLLELVVSMAITSVAMACVFVVVAPAREAFAVQPEAADVQQRVRVAVATLTKNLRMAGAGRRSEAGCAGRMGAPVLPYRVGAIANDAAAGTFYRPDTISVVYADAASSPVPDIIRRTYYLKRAPPDSSQLMQYDGRETDHPMLEDVVRLTFDYFGVPPAAVSASESDAVMMDPAELTDGPWCPDSSSSDRFDEDLLRVRRIRVRLRVQAPRPFRGPAGPLFTYGGDARSPAYVPDQEIRFDVAPRNMTAILDETPSEP